MKPKNLLVASSMCFALVLAACGGSSGDSDDSGSSLQGDWKDACVDPGNGLFEQASLSISGSELSRSVSFYTDASCADNFAAATIAISGTFVEGASSEGAQGTQTEIDITFTAQNETWFLAGDIENFNTAERCGINNWAIGVSFDVTNCADAIGGFPMPATIYDIYAISGDDLYTGSPDAGQTPETRPTELSSEPEYSR